MTALAAVDKVKRLRLTDAQRQFALEYHSGELAGNAVQCYRKVFPEVNYNTASVQATELLKHPSVRALLEELHRETVERAVQELQPWIDLLPQAQSVILATLEGKLRNRMAYEAAIYLVNRVLGSPTASATLDLQVHNHGQMTAAVRTFMDRMSELQVSPRPEGK